MSLRPIILPQSESRLMATRAIFEAVAFCELGDLLSLDLRDGETSGPGCSCRFIRFSGWVRLYGLAIMGINGRVVVIKDDDIRRWVPVRIDLEVDRVKRLSVDFAHWIEPNYHLALGLTEGHCEPDAWPINPDPDRCPELMRMG